MAVLTITRANVGVDTKNIQVTPYEAGEAIEQGEPFYIAADGKAYVASASAGAAINAEVAGIAVTKATAAGKTLLSVNANDIIPGATLTKGRLYYLGANGAIAQYSDLLSGYYITPLFRAKDTTSATMELRATGITV